MAEAAKKMDATETPAETVSGGHLVAKALKNEGVDTIFTLCGGHIIDIYDGCLDEGIKIVDVRHEQVAAHAADGYARQTGKLGCVVTTAGPGCTNDDLDALIEALERRDTELAERLARQHTLDLATHVERNVHYLD